MPKTYTKAPTTTGITNEENQLDVHSSYVPAHPLFGLLGHYHLLMSIIIKQPPIYIDFAAPDWVEPYDHTLVACECGKLMERGMGLCDSCIDRESRIMEADLKELAKKWKDREQDT